MKNRSFREDPRPRLRTRKAWAGIEGTLYLHYNLQPTTAYMKYQLSFCEIEQLSDNVFETTPKKGIVLDKKCVDEVWSHWDKIRDKPFGLLVNYKNTYTHSPEGARYVGKHPLQRKTAILCTDPELIKEIQKVVKIKKMHGSYIYHQVFSDRDEALKWLSNI